VVQWPAAAADADTAPQPQPQPQAAEQPAGQGDADTDLYPIKLERMINCRTYLKRMHITGRMAELLLPRFEAASRSDTNHLQDHDYRILFKQTINLVDAEGFGGRLLLECCRVLMQRRPA
jgi:hypothetical protein